MPVKWCWVPMRPVLEQCRAKEVIRIKKMELGHHFKHIQYDRIRSFFDRHLKDGAIPH